jgi:hypothetical protein
VGWSPHSGWSAEQASAPKVAIVRPVPDPVGHHQPTRSEIEEREAERTGMSAPALPGELPQGGSGDPMARFLGACMSRMRPDDPLGTEQAHRAFCTCRSDAVSRSAKREALAPIAANLEARNALDAAPPRLPEVIDRSNQAAITKCMSELSR